MREKNLTADFAPNGCLGNLSRSGSLSTEQLKDALNLESAPRVSAGKQTRFRHIIYGHCILYIMLFS